MKIKIGMLTLLLLAGCGSPCVNTPVEDLVSPDGKHQAAAFIRDCGATTDFSPQVYLRKAGEKAEDKGNVFIGNHSDRIHIRWKPTGELYIFSDCDVVTHHETWNGIKIIFKQFKKT